MSKKSSIIHHPSFINRLAIIISRIFDPAWLIPGMLAVAVGWSLLNGLRWRFIVILLLIDGLIPFIYFVHLLSTKEISDWDTTKREQRLKLYGFVLVSHAIGVILAFLLGKLVLSKILLLFLILAAVFTLITFRWKISIHTGVSSAATVFLSFLFGRNWLWLYLIVGIIAWARVVMQKHTLAQTVAGAIVSAGIIFMGFKILGINPEGVISSSNICQLGRLC